MKAKRIAALLLVFTALYGATAYADTLWGTYGDYAKAKIRVNGEDMKFAEGDVPAFIIDGRTVIPLKPMTDVLRGLVNWTPETQIVDIHKPNVHMFFAQDVNQEDFSLEKPFAKVSRGDTIDFVVFSQVDNLNVKVDGFRVRIEDPEGKEATEPLVVKLDSKEKSFWYPWPFYKVSFDQAGEYTVKFEFLYNGEYRVVSEKTITAE